MAAALADWLPTVADVANLIPQRTGDPSGNAQATFTVNTVPTASQVAGLVRGVQSEVLATVGAMPADLCVVPAGGSIGESAAGHVVALGAASLVEAGFYPDLQLSGNSPATVLDGRYRLALKALAIAVNEINAGQDPGDQPRPKATFPDTVAWGRGTTSWERW